MANKELKIQLYKERPPRVAGSDESWWRYDITSDGGIMLTGWVQGNKRIANRKAVAMKARLTNRGKGLSPVRMVNNGPGINKRTAEDLL